MLTAKMFVAGPSSTSGLQLLAVLGVETAAGRERGNFDVGKPFLC